jgi:1-acyl-sn-glycerol-3-phosphate acyltransferase
MMVYASDRIVHMLAKKELFSNFITNWFFRSYGAIPVDRKIHDSNAKTEALEVLKQNKVLGIFPEGTTNKTIGTANFNNNHYSFTIEIKDGNIRHSLLSYNND